jgi:hypothetical protein
MSSPAEVSATLACTQKLRKLVGEAAAPIEVSRLETSIEFYANLLWLDGRKCLLVTEAQTLFCFLVPDVRKRDLTPIGSFFVPRLEFELVTEGLPRDLFGSLDSERIRVAPTRDRAVVGALVEFGRMCKYRVEDAGGLEHADISLLNHKLRRTPMARRQRSYTFPIDAARALAL